MNSLNHGDPTCGYLLRINRLAHEKLFPNRNKMNRNLINRNRINFFKMPGKNSTQKKIVILQTRNSHLSVSFRFEIRSRKYGDTRLDT